MASALRASAFAWGITLFGAAKFSTEPRPLPPDRGRKRQREGIPIVG